MFTLEIHHFTSAIFVENRWYGRNPRSTGGRQINRTDEGDVMAPGYWAEHLCR